MNTDSLPAAPAVSPSTVGARNALPTTARTIVITLASISHIIAMLAAFLTVFSSFMAKNLIMICGIPQ